MSSPIPTRSLGETGVKVGAIGHGLMQLTWTTEPPTDEQSFASMLAALEAGATFWNSGSFYGPNDDPLANLKLLNRFFEKYPETADKITLSIKGGTAVGGLYSGFDSSVENMRRDLKEIQTALGTIKKIDVYEPARLDPKQTVEFTVSSLATLQKEGLFKHIGLSECAASAVRRAAKVATIAAVEIELSLWSLEDETYKVIEACKDNGIALIAYSPLGRGMLAGKYRTPDDLPKDDMRRGYPRFQGEAFYTNLKLVDAVNNLGKEKGATGGQLALAYIMSMYDKVIPIPGSSSDKRVKENIEAANINLSQSDIAAIDKILKEFDVVGDRYPHSHGHLNFGTGKVE